jgi:chromosome segregation ATPase
MSAAFAAKLYLRRFVHINHDALARLQTNTFTLEKKREVLQRKLIKLEKEMNEVMHELQSLSTHTKKPALPQIHPLDELDHQLRKLETMHQLLLQQPVHPKDTLRKIESRIRTIRKKIEEKRFGKR